MPDINPDDTRIANQGMFLSNYNKLRMPFFRDKRSIDVMDICIVPEHTHGSACLTFKMGGECAAGGIDGKFWQCHGDLLISVVLRTSSMGTHITLA
jgi:hypothetical protein